MNNHFINSPVDLLVLLALDHHHLAHLLLGVDLIQALLQLLLQKVFLIQDESIASDLKVPSCKLDSSAPLQDMTVLKTSPSSQFNAFSIGYRYYAFTSQAKFTMSEIKDMPLCGGTFWKVEITNTWTQGKGKSWAVCKRTF